MKKRTLDNLKTLVISSLLVFLLPRFEFLPWWSFTVPVVLLGVVIKLKRWNVGSFSMGFLAGFLVWFGSNLYFDFTLSSSVLNKISLILSIPKILILLASGILGGLLTGLSLYTGKKMLTQDEIHDLE